MSALYLQTPKWDPVLGAQQLDPNTCLLHLFHALALQRLQTRCL